ncbi:hypothetical protein AB0I51_14980 [Streptomyces sp. NPDC050549]|uniref:hypothetical protein n=1 Tax=Streptomyces sp. NPDC050549 TaxID=3155406 RepID=UPI00343C996C
MEKHKIPAKSGKEPDSAHGIPKAGYPESVHAAVNIAAPMLAAGAVTITGVVAADEVKFRWAGVAMLCLTLAAVSLIASVQFGFRARSYHFSQEELERWVADTDAADHYRDRANRDRAIGTARNMWRKKVRSAVYTYNFGTVLLGVGLAVALVPKSGSAQPGVRWAAAALALLATVGEAVWGWRLTVPHTAPPPPPVEGPATDPALTKSSGGSAPAGLAIEGTGHHDA